MQLEKHQLLLLCTNKHWGAEPSSSCHTQTSAPPCPISYPSLSEPRGRIGTTRSLQFNMFKIQGSFLCLSPFLINFWVPVLMFSISLSKTGSWAVHLLLQQRWSWKTTPTSQFFNHLKKWWLCNPALSYHWIGFWNILIIRFLLPVNIH